ncbi:MAG: MerR family transcriptional regulator, partial [Bacteroidia bacterium]
IESITGIKAHTIRIWEQRYNLVTPKRSDTNIRYYDDEDVKLLLNISLLNKKGLKISKIANLTQSQIHAEALNTCKKRHENDDLINALLVATFKLNENDFIKVLSDFTRKEGFENTITKLAFPFLQRLGDLWASNVLHPALEHFASNIIKKEIEVKTASQTKKATANKKFLLFLPPGEMHELGLIYANYLIRSHGHEVLYFGQNTPVADLFKMIKNFKTDYILSVFTTCNSDMEPLKFVNEIHANWPKVKIILAGCRLKSQPCQCFISSEFKNRVTVLNEPCELKVFLETV